ncbi:MAG: L-histidine N(alpha)-methyltransferase [Bacteriovoracaceae bacterium]|nr:L-histidine N(alpha)-methyltransferase [Bacteriovoracaceae bacterium]
MEPTLVEKKDQDLAFKVDVFKGLRSIPKSISSKYFYDDEGSLIFQEITQMKEYYPTRLEMEVFEQRKYDIVRCMASSEVDVVELGAGDGHKTKVLLEQMNEQDIKVNFYPIDISEKALDELLKNVSSGEKLKVHPVVGEYMSGLAKVCEMSKKPKFVLFLGSNIGNFGPGERVSFLNSLQKNLNVGDMILIGFDLKKDVRKLVQAYDDPSGVTAKFNLNLLKRINRELGGHFDPDSFYHHAFYNPLKGAMESCLLSSKEQDVVVDEFGTSFHFEPYEAIHLEHSYKFTLNEIEDMAQKCGFRVNQHFQGTSGGYVNSLWEVRKGVTSLH